MIERFLTSAGFRQDASALALIHTLDPRDPNRAIDTHHQLVWSLFADDAGIDGKRDFLWRYDDGRLQILSVREPRDPHRLFDMDTRRVALRFEPGERLAFRLRANATVSRGDGRIGQRSSRHDVVMDTLLRIQSERPELERAEARDEAVPIAADSWLRRTGERAGFELERVLETSYRTVELPRRAGQGGSGDGGRQAAQSAGKAAPARFGVLDMDGVIQVREPDSFVEAVAQGFGRGKAFGFGLMLLDRA